MKRKVIIPPAIGAVLSLGGAALQGLHKLGGTLDVKYSIEAVVRAILEAAVKANLEYQTVKSKSLAATEALDGANERANSLIRLARDVLKPKLGTRYSQAWDQTGFFKRNLGVPGTLSQRLALLQSLELYFTDHPEVGSDLVTHTMLGDARTVLADRLSAANDARVEQRQKKAVRDAALKALAKRLLALRKELTLLMANDDPRWIDFGFGVPADVHVPEAPEGPKLTLHDGHLVASWEDTVNVDRFRVSQRLVGSDTEYMPVATTTETSFDLGVFPPGAHVAVQVTAINSAGESVPSETVEMVVPESPS